MQFTHLFLVYFREAMGAPLFKGDCSFSEHIFSFLFERFTSQHREKNFPPRPTEFKSKMRSVLFLYPESDSNKARRLMNYYQGRLGKIADVRGIKNILVREQDFGKQLRLSECVVLVGTRQASSLIQNKQQEKDDDFITFDGKVMHEVFTENKDLVKNRLLIVHFTERTEDDWIPKGFDEKRIFLVEDGIVPPDGSPTLTHLEYRIKKVLLGDSFMY